MKHKILLILSVIFLPCLLCSYTRDATSDTQNAASASWYINQDYFAAISKDAHKELTRACNRKDEQTVRRMMVNGTVVILSKYTDIDMVDYGLALCKVKPLSGSYAGCNLYVDTEAVSSR